MASFASVERIQVLPDRVLFSILIPDPAHRKTNPDIARRAANRRPNLLAHACVNSKGAVFASVLEDTPIPHLVEHCVIDFLVEESKDEKATYMGTSRWIDVESGRAQIQISMNDDLAVLRAFKHAMRFLEEEVIL